MSDVATEKKAEYTYTMFLREALRDHFAEVFGDYERAKAENDLPAVGLDEPSHEAVIQSLTEVRDFLTAGTDEQFENRWGTLMAVLTEVFARDHSGEIVRLFREQYNECLRDQQVEFIRARLASLLSPEKPVEV